MKKVNFINSTEYEGLSPPCIGLSTDLAQFNGTVIFFFGLIPFSHFFILISNFFGPSATEET
jgi:hypothetical protein